MDGVRPMGYSRGMKPLSGAFIVAGAILLAFGVRMSQSAASTVSRVFTGGPTHEAMVLLVCGAVAVTIGVLTRGR